MSAGFPRISPRRRNPDEAPKLKWYVATFQVLFIIALIIGVCVALVVVSQWMSH